MRVMVVYPIEMTAAHEINEEIIPTDKKSATVSQGVPRASSKDIAFMLGNELTGKHIP
jgi:hypothetical protein